jgi:ABC-2 type transport system permease protein
MLAIAFRTLRSKKISIAVYAFAGLAFIWMYVLLYPTIKGQGETYNQLLENFPEELARAFGIVNLSFSTLETFLVTEQFNLMWSIIALFLLISWAGSSIAGEVEAGTMDIVLSSPISRAQVFFAKYVSGLVVFATFILFSIVSVIPLATFHGIEYDATSYFVFAAMSFLFGWAVFSLASFFSALFSERGNVYRVMGGGLVLMYITSIVALLQDNLSFLKYASFFYYVNVNELLLEHSFSMLSVAVFTSVALASTAAGAYILSQKDINAV